MWFFFVVVVYFIKFFSFLFLLILMDNIPSCPGLCQVGRRPCPPQTSGFPFGSSLESSLKAGPCCQRLPSDFFFFFLTLFRVYRNVLQRIRSALSCVSFWFLPLLKNQFHEERQKLSCMCCARGQFHAGVRVSHAYMCVNMETSTPLPTSAPALVFLSKLS